jgi:hypothetical protein
MYGPWLDAVDGCDDIIRPVQAHDQAREHNQRLYEFCRLGLLQPLEQHNVYVLEVQIDAGPVNKVDCCYQL